jgi:hypothetical protein
LVVAVITVLGGIAEIFLFKLYVLTPDQSPRKTQSLLRIAITTTGAALSSAGTLPREATF